MYVSWYTYKKDVTPLFVFIYTPSVKENIFQEFDDKKMKISKTTRFPDKTTI